MAIEIKQTIPVERVETEGVVDKIQGISKARSFRGWLQGRINVFLKQAQRGSRFANDMEKTLKTVLNVYNKFHPETKVALEIEGWKGKSGVQIIAHPEYFECIEFRKQAPGEEPKKVINKVYKKDFNDFLVVLGKLELNKRYATREVAEIWCRTNHIWNNYHGRKIFDNQTGFNFANVAGCRSSYMRFYYPIKICEYYKLIKYEKRGFITRLKEDLKIQTGFG
jgi:hypothetical protein